MKKGKKGRILLMAFTTWAALIAGCGKWPGNQPDKMQEDRTIGADTENTENQQNIEITSLPDIQELRYYKHGTMVEPIWSVSLIRQGEGALEKNRLQVIFVYPAAKVIYLLPDE